LAEKAPSTEHPSFVRSLAKNFTNFSLRKKLWYVYTYIFKSRCIVNDFFFAFLTLLCFSFELS